MRIEKVTILKIPAGEKGMKKATKLKAQIENEGKYVSWSQGTKWIMLTYIEDVNDESY